MADILHGDESGIDKDIAELKLSYAEKSGLQVYRNYSCSFEQHAISHFVEKIDREALDLADFRRLSELICTEEARFLPVIVCAFADELLKKAFKAMLPEGIPGGKSSLLGGYGPLSDLAKRIQLAYAFDAFSADLMQVGHHRKGFTKWSLAGAEPPNLAEPVQPYARKLAVRESGGDVVGGNICDQGPTASARFGGSASSGKQNGHGHAHGALIGRCARCGGEVVEREHTATSSGKYLHNACVDAWSRQ